MVSLVTDENAKRDRERQELLQLRQQNRRENRQDCSHLSPSTAVNYIN